MDELGSIFSKVNEQVGVGDTLSLKMVPLIVDLNQPQLLINC